MLAGCGCAHRCSPRKKLLIKSIELKADFFHVKSHYVSGCRLDIQVYPVAENATGGVVVVYTEPGAVHICKVYVNISMAIGSAR